MHNVCILWITFSSKSSVSSENLIYICTIMEIARSKFSFMLSDDLKVRLEKIAASQNRRSFGNFIETVLFEYAQDNEETPIEKWLIEHGATEEDYGVLRRKSAPRGVSLNIDWLREKGLLEEFDKFMKKDTVELQTVTTKNLSGE